MNLGEYKILIIVIGLIGVLIIASPAFEAILSYAPLPKSEQFSELYLLGPEHVAENYPYTINVGQNYSIYVGVGNQLFNSAYYLLSVKLGSHSDFSTNAKSGEPFPFDSLYEFRFILENEQNWESSVTFSVLDTSFTDNQSVIKQLTINGVTFDVNEYAFWDSDRNGYFYQLIFELWIFDSSQSTMIFHNRYVNLQLSLIED